MISETKKHLKCILILLLICAVIAVAVYALHATAEEKLTKYEEDLAAIPVTLTVTTPTGELETEILKDGTVYERELSIPNWVYQIFTEREPVKFYDVSEAKDLSEANKLRKDEPSAELSFAEYVKDVQLMVSEQINKVGDYSFSIREYYYAYGITSLDCVPLFASDWESEITWFDGYDESIFASNGLYCLIPASKLEEYDNGNGEAVVSFYYTAMSHQYVDGELVKEKEERECPYTLKIAGTYTGGDWNSIYCPLDIVEKACSELESTPLVLSLSATLADNSRLEEFREKMSLCFLEPAPENEDIPWGYYVEWQNIFRYHDVYPLGLAIDDEALLALPDVTGVVGVLKTIVKIGIAVIAVIIAGISVGLLVIFLKNKKKNKALKPLHYAYISGVALLLFSAIVTTSICYLHASTEVEKRNYEEACLTSPITLTVTDPWGNFRGYANYVDGSIKWDTDFFSVYGWIFDLFTSEEPVRFYDVSGVENPEYNREAVEEIMNETEPIELSLSEYVKNVQIKKAYEMTEVNGRDCSDSNLIGITSMSCVPELDPARGCEIVWYEGYDESIFDGDELLCLIPEDKIDRYDNGNGEAEIYFKISSKKITYVDGQPVRDEVEYREYRCTLKIAGTHKGKDYKGIYCSLPVFDQVCSELDVTVGIDAMSMTLADNSRLDEFREKMSFCLTEADPDAELKKWGSYANTWYNEYYDRALDIDDEHLKEMYISLEESIEHTRRVTQMILAVAAVMSLVIACLAICSRKRDEALMRRFGESKIRVCARLMIEQMVCVLIGIILGGAYFLWKPIVKLSIFALIYLVALTFAIAILMSKKPIKTDKEENQ